MLPTHINGRLTAIQESLSNAPGNDFRGGLRVLFTLIIRVGSRPFNVHNCEPPRRTLTAIDQPINMN